jgi:hypothetical protein
MIVDYIHGNERIQFVIPASCREITYSAFIDFRHTLTPLMQEKYADGPENAGEEEIENEVSPEDAMMIYMEAVAKVVQGPVHILPIGTPEDFVEGTDLADHFKIGGELSVMLLYVWVLTLVNSYEAPKMEEAPGYAYTHKGKKYKLSAGDAEAMLSGITFTAGEVLTVESTRQWFENIIRDHGDQDGAMSFTMDLKVLAAIFRPEGEQLPYNVSKRDRYIEDRAQELSDLPFDVVLDIRFFLTSILLRFAQTVTTQLYSTASLNPKTLRVHWKHGGIMRKRKHGRKRGKKKSASG